MKILNPARLFYFLILTALFSGCVAVPAPSLSTSQEVADRGEKIRVQVLNAVDSLVIEGAEGRIDIKAAPGARMIVEKKQWYGPYLYNGSGSVFSVNDNSYRGTIEIERVEGGLRVINELPLERYLVGLINKEISSSWHEDVLKTQAVIARTYALFQKKKRDGEPFHLSSTTADQVYGGAGSEDNLAFQAVRATRGEVITFGGALALTLYHSNAGGRTEAAKNVWGGDYSYLISTKSPHDKKDPRYEWEYQISVKELSAKLAAKGHGTGKVKKVRIESKLKSGRVRELAIRGKVQTVRVSGEDLRAMLGYTHLRSTLFKVRKKGNTFIFTGKGSGHGVGLSQWGARGMADSGVSYRKILEHYYPGTTIQKLY